MAATGPVCSIRVTLKQSEENYMASETEPGRLLRLYQIIGDKKKGIAPIIPVGRSTWWNGVVSGRFPKPIKLGKGITVWRSEDIKAYVESQN